MLDVNAIYNKTELGVGEVQSRALGLRAELRRLLILVDGKTPIGRLATFVRGAEIATLIFELETQGLISSPTTNGYRKTDAGVAEVQKRMLGLRPSLRRLLILVDGRTPLDRLSGLIPGLDVRALVDELEALGLVAAPNTPNTSNTPNTPNPPTLAVATGLAAAAAPGDELAALSRASGAATPAQPVAGFAERAPAPASHALAVRRAAVHELQRLLGVTEHELLDRLQRPGDSRALRAVISEVHQTLDEQFGVETGQRFLDAVRGAASTGSGQTA